MLAYFRQAARSINHETFNQGVAGSNPAGLTIGFAAANQIRRLNANRVTHWQRQAENCRPRCAPRSTTG